VWNPGRDGLVLRFGMASREKAIVRAISSRNDVPIPSRLRASCVVANVSKLCLSLSRELARRMKKVGLRRVEGAIWFSGTPEGCFIP